MAVIRLSPPLACHLASPGDATRPGAPSFAEKSVVPSSTLGRCTSLADSALAVRASGSRNGSLACTSKSTSTSTSVGSCSSAFLTSALLPARHCLGSQHQNPAGRQLPWAGPLQGSSHGTRTGQCFREAAGSRVVAVAAGAEAGAGPVTGAGAGAETGAGAGTVTVREAGAGTGAGVGAEGLGVGRGKAHELFDHATIVVKAGDGGNGTVLRVPRPGLAGKDQRAKGVGLGKAGKSELRKERERQRQMTQLRRDANGMAILPQGGQGGDVILVADPRCTTLLPFHAAVNSAGQEAQDKEKEKEKGPAHTGKGPLRRFVAGAGGNVDSAGSLARLSAEGNPGKPLRIPVPVGTVVKRRKGGKLLADLVRAGDEVVVSRGGRGGLCVYELPSQQGSPGRVGFLKLPEGVPVLKAWEDRQLTQGQAGEEAVLELILRVVADVGLVGLPNAGKSSLLAALTRARPAVAPYPFTTLIPNLGKMAGDPDTAIDGGYALSGPTLADLPGLIRGASQGKGLGRMFLRHLRRTRLLLHLVDASAPAPGQDYADLREELRLYNPEYTQRPHVVVLNKMDLPEAAERKEETVKGILEVCRGRRSSRSEDEERRRSEGAGVVEVHEVSGVGSGASGGAGGVGESTGSSAVTYVGLTAPAKKPVTGGDMDEAWGQASDPAPFGPSWGQAPSEVFDGSPAALPVLPPLDYEGGASVAESDEFSRQVEGVRVGAAEMHCGEVPDGAAGFLSQKQEDAGSGAWGDGVGQAVGDSLPMAIVAISAKEGLGMEELVQVINWAMQEASVAAEEAKEGGATGRGQQGRQLPLSQKPMQGRRTLPSREGSRRLTTPQWQL